jgi:pyruvate dehydrogenase E1 component
MNEKELREFRDRFGIPIADRDLMETPFYRPPDDSEEIQYLLERRRALGGFVPARRVHAVPLSTPPADWFAEFTADTGEREAATTMALVRLLQRLMSEPELGKLIVPIVPDEARTFGMDALFRKFGIYSHLGQRYEPADSDVVLFYREATDGQLLEEGITEAGAMSSFQAAGTAYATHGVNTVPFFFFYSMFGFQRIGDLIWQNADARGRGFLVGATAGRTTLAGEGLQHQDGHSQLLASVVPTLHAYDPAFAYEIAVIVQDGLRRMYGDGEACFYYLTVYNEMYAMPAMPAGVDDGIRRGIYRLAPAPAVAGPRVHLFASGPIVREALKAQSLLEERGVGAAVWSVTSYSELRREALAAERWSLLHPLEPARLSYLSQQLADEPGRWWRRATICAPSPIRSPASSPAGSPRSAPTASAAATRAMRCAASSRSTPRRSRSPRWASSPVVVRSTRTRCAGPWTSSASTPSSPIRRQLESFEFFNAETRHS